MSANSLHIAKPAVFEYADAHTEPLGSEFDALLADTQATAPSPTMVSGVSEIRLLEAFIVAGQYKNVVEVGTFTGAGAISMAAVMPEGGLVTTIENDEMLAAVAKKHIDLSPHKDKLKLIVGDAREELAKIDGPIDLVYIDAWKFDYWHYYETVLPKLAPNGMILCDNVLWRGRVLDPANADDDETEALVEFNEKIKNDKRVVSTMLTVGDGVSLIRFA
ncbi:MAG TPA: O-methyltransferase [Baekduia sp.]|nr:O-methyltransferase [Baekduia sp.]